MEKELIDLIRQIPEFKGKPDNYLYIKQVSTNLIYGHAYTPGDEKAFKSWVENNPREWRYPTKEDIQEIHDKGKSDTTNDNTSDEGGKYDGLKVAELKEEIEKRGIELDGGEKKADLVAILEKNDEKE